MPDYDSQANRAMPVEPQPAPSDGAASDEDDLRAGLVGLAQIIAGRHSLRDLLAQIADLAVAAIPGATSAGVSVLWPGGRLAVQAWGGSDDTVAEIDRIQYELLDDGPCLTCMQTARPAVSGSLGSDDRWPRFGGHVTRLGLHSAMSLPLLVGEQMIGSINSYATERDAFTEHSVEAGVQFAVAAAVAAHNAQLLDAASTKAEQLQTALVSRAVIDQAIGIVRSRSGGTADEAFARLKKISQTENVKLAVIAQRIVDEAVRRAHAQHSRD